MFQQAGKTRARAPLTRALLIGTAASLCSMAASAQDTVPNPFYEGWKGFNPGSEVTRVERTELSGSDALLAPDGVAIKVATYTLLEATDDRVVIQTKVLEHDFLSFVESAPTRIIYPAKVKRTHAEALRQLTGAERGEGPCKLLGKDTTCKTLAGKVSRGDTKTEYRLWSLPSVPGGIVKQIRSTTDPAGAITTTVEVKAYRAQ